MKAILVNGPRDGAETEVNDFPPEILWPSPLATRAFVIEDEPPTHQRVRLACYRRHGLPDDDVCLYHFAGWK